MGNEIKTNDNKSKFSKYSTEQLKTSLDVIKSQNIEGYTQEMGQLIERELKTRLGNN
jgi:hypothetical protein